MYGMYAHDVCIWFNQLLFQNFQIVIFPLKQEMGLGWLLSIDMTILQVIMYFYVTVNIFFWNTGIYLYKLIKV